jgi:hypothetical protein
VGNISAGKGQAPSPVAAVSVSLSLSPLRISSVLASNWIEHKEPSCHRQVVIRAAKIAFAFGHETSTVNSFLTTRAQGNDAYISALRARILLVLLTFERAPIRVKPHYGFENNG